MTLEQRIARAERMLKTFVRRGRKYRTEFRDSVNILIAMQMKDNEDWRARKREMDERIKILINAQIATEEQIKSTDEQIKKTDEQIAALAGKTEQALDRLSASQAKTEEALRRFINSLNKGRNGNSEN